MTWEWDTGTRQDNGVFERARANARQRLLVQRGQAARTVAQQAADPDDCRRLLSMLGLDDEPSRWADR